MLKNIVLPLDGSELSEQAIPYAQQIIGNAGQINLLTVVDVPSFPSHTIYPVPIAVPEPDYMTVVDDMIANARDYIDNLAKRLQSQGYNVKTVVKSGDPAVGILEVAQNEEADAIVMSTHGRSGMSKWLFGSVTQKILSAMPCPVFVIPGVREQTHLDEKVTETVEN